jgi:hypothetical protein
VVDDILGREAQQAAEEIWTKPLKNLDGFSFWKKGTT